MQHALFNTVLARGTPQDREEKELREGAGEPGGGRGRNSINKVARHRLRRRSEIRLMHFIFVAAATEST